MNFKITIETEEGRIATNERNISIDMFMLNSKEIMEAKLISDAADGAMLCMRTLLKPPTEEK